jgi:hypothetical protein
MQLHVCRAVCSLLLVGVNFSANAVELKECLKLVVKSNGDASLANACSNMLNVTYCVDNPKSARACSAEPLGITTLSPGSSDLIPSYVDSGAGAVYWAVCVYPEAAVDWKPGPESGHACRKTCVMC